VFGILGRIKHNAEPSKFLGNTGTETDRMFADPRREHEGVDPLQCGGEHACIKAHAVDEIVNRE
jgi:hypothetical protein